MPNEEERNEATIPLCGEEKVKSVTFASKMGKYGVKVCIRTRPTASFAQDQILIDADKSVREPFLSIAFITSPGDT